MDVPDLNAFKCYKEGCVVTLLPESYEDVFLKSDLKGSELIFTKNAEACFAPPCLERKVFEKIGLVASENNGKRLAVRGGYLFVLTLVCFWLFMLLAFKFSLKEGGSKYLITAGPLKTSGVELGSDSSQRRPFVYFWK